MIGRMLDRLRSHPFPDVNGFLDDGEVIWLMKNGQNVALMNREQFYQIMGLNA